MAAAMADDNWTSVSRSRNSRNPQPIVNGTPRPSRDITLDDIKREFEAKTKQWQKTDCRKQLLRELYRPVEDDDGIAVIERYICVGAGSLSRDNVECRRRSMWQMVVFVDLVRWMLDFYELPIEGYGAKDAVDNWDVHQGRRAQGIWACDPAYTELDVEFLKTVGVEVHQHEEGEVGFGKLAQYLEGGRTFLFEPFVDMNDKMVRDMVASDVALYIGSSIGGVKERRGEAGDLAMEFTKDRNMKKFPSFEVDPNIFEGMGIYWKEKEDMPSRIS